MFRPRPRFTLPTLSSFALALCLTGCGAGTPATTASSGSIQIRGSVIGGQQPVAFSTIKMYAAGKAGNGSAATSMLLLPVMSDLNGNFNLALDYTCANSEDQVYLVAQGGNPGLAAGTNNAALVMVSAVGRCANLPTTAFITINELTTVAAAWALAPFIATPSAVGASATNAAGITNGFKNAALIASPYTGQPATLASNLTLESAKVISLSNAIGACINSDGTSGCTALFAAATVGNAAMPTDTLTAALNIVRNPGNNVAGVYNAAGSVPPFGGGLSQAPNDWTLSLTVTGGGVNSPTALGIDSTGNVWVASYNGFLSLFSPQAVPMSGAGFGIGYLSEAYGLTVDSNNDVWVTIEEQPHHSPTRGSSAKFLGVAAGSNTGQLAGYYYDSLTDYPVAIAADTNGNVVAADYANSSSTVYNTSGTIIGSGYGGGGNLDFPVAVAFDSTHGYWLANQGDYSVTHLSSTGALLARPTTCCNGSNGIAIDSIGNAWVANYYGSSVSEVSAAGAPIFTNIVTGGISSPSGVIIDGAQDVWIANYRGTSFTHLAGNASTLPAGTAISPATGFGRDAALLLPYDIALDATGDVWLTNFAENNIVEFFGLATPVKTPVSPIPVAP